MRGWRPALRIARRSIRRNLGRSLLVAVLVGLPVAGATMVDILVRTLSANEREARRALGPADAQASVTASSRLSGYVPGPYANFGAAGDGEPDRDPAEVDLEALLPAGSRAALAPLHAQVRVRRGESTLRVELVVADATEPLHADDTQMDEGRAPARPVDVLVTPALAERLGDLRPGATVTPAEGPPLTVTGLAHGRFCLSCEQIIAPPGSLGAGLAAHEPAHPGGQVDYLVDLPDDDAGVKLWPALAERGVALVPRDAYLHPDRYSPSDAVASIDSVRTAALVVLIAGLGLLEIVLLAGTAFAVGARRQTRELGLVAATGGTARDVRRIVLAQGVVLGALGAALGLAVGALLAVGGRPLWERLDDAEILAWAFGPWEIAGAALVGLLSGLAAAVIPALGAGRMRAVDALAGRFRTTRAARRRAAATGATLAVVGALMGLAGDRLLAADFAEYGRLLADEATAGSASAPSQSGPLALIVGGATLLVAGLLILAPVMIGRLAAVAGRLPLSPRLAFRDAARHRHRTGPATGAIAMAVAGSVVLSFILAGTFRAEELRHVPALPPHLLAVEPGEADLVAARGGAQAAAAALPEARTHVLRQPLRPLAEGEQATPEELLSREIYVMAPSDDDADCEDGGCVAGGHIAMAGSGELNAVAAGGSLDDEARAALAEGKVLVFGPALIADGRVRLEVGYDDVAEQPRTVSLPAHLAERRLYTGLPYALLPAAVARARRWATAPSRVFVDYAASATRDEVDTALSAAEQSGATAFVEDGPDTPSQAILLVIAAAAGFVTLVGVAISVSLSAAEGRADLATLAAVGAPPSRRRALAASQALLVGGLGCALGVAFGTFVAYTVRTTTGAPELVVPWLNLAAIGVAIPLLAVLVATVFTPSRLPLVRRLT